METEKFHGNVGGAVGREPGGSDGIQGGKAAEAVDKWEGVIGVATDCGDEGVGFADDHVWTHPSRSRW